MAQQREQAVTSAVRACLDPQMDLQLTQHVQAALLSGVERARYPWVDTLPALWGYETGRSDGPDLLLVDAQDTVKVMVENKISAKANGTLAKTVLTSLTDEPIADQLRRPSTPLDQSCSGSATRHCGCYTHKSDGRPAYFQIDYAALSRRWVPKGVTVPEVHRVILLLLDLRGRSAAEAFAWRTDDSDKQLGGTSSVAHTAELWSTTSYNHFASLLAASMGVGANGSCPGESESLRNLQELLAAELQR